MTILTLQPDAAAGIDTYILSASPTQNFGVGGMAAGKAGSAVYRGLLKFDLSALPPGAVVTSAILTLRCSGVLDNTSIDIAVHRSLVEWFEGFKNGAAPDGGQDGSTWNLRNANGSVAWVGGAGGASGSDWAATATDTTAVVLVGDFYDWDVTADVADWADGTPSNHGWFVLGPDGVATYKAFNSSDTATAGHRPQLVIAYTEEMSGSFSAGASFSGALAGQGMSGTFAGQSTISGAAVGWGLLSGTFDGEAAFSGEMPAQEMSGSFAGESSFTGGGRAVLLPRVPIWTAIVGGVEYAISGGNPFYRLQATGLGIPNIRNIKQRGPFQDGATRRDFRLDERFLNLVFLLQGATCAQADTYRDTLIEIFKPLTNTPCQIRVTRDDGVIKQIDTYAVGVLDLPETEGERFAATQRVMVQLEAPNPIWYGPTLQNLGFTSVLGGTEGFQIPMMIPWAQQPGEYINATESFYYEGNWKEYPVIVITGPAVDAKITNLTTNEKIDFTGHTIAAGDTRTIDLRFGTKTVKDAFGVLKNSELTTDSNLGTFHLEPSPGASGGINDIKVEILSGATPATRVSIRYFNRYIHL